MTEPSLYYVNDPQRLEEIDYEDLLLLMEEHPGSTETIFIALLKQKYAFGRIDDELIHHLITIENDKNSLQELLRTIQHFPTKSELLSQQRENIAKQTDEFQHKEVNEEGAPISVSGSDNVNETLVDKSEKTNDPNDTSSEEVENTEELESVSSHSTKKIDGVSAEDDKSSEKDMERSTASPVSSESEESTKRPKKKKKNKFEKLVAKQKRNTPPSNDYEDSDATRIADNSFSAWLHSQEVLPGTAREFKRRKKGVKAKKIKKKTKAEKQAAQSIAENKEVVSETLATIFAQQELYDKAIQMYKKLSLKFPEKSAFFAEKVKDIENLKSQ